MKNFKLNHLLALSLIVLVVNGCAVKPPQVTNLKTTPNPLEMHGGKVIVKVEGKITETPGFNPKLMINIMPVFKDKSGQVIEEMKQKTFQGEQVRANNEVIKKTGGVVKYDGSTTYDKRMRNSDVYMKVIAYLEARENTPLLQVDTFYLAPGVITTPELCEKGLEVDVENFFPGGFGGAGKYASTEIAKDKFERTKVVPYKADIHYLMQSTAENKQLSGNDTKQLEQNIVDQKKNATVELKSISIDAYASPDGDEAKINKPLAENRRKSAESYVASQLKKNKYTNVAQNTYAMKSVAEDWDGFQREVNASNVPDKALILRVLSMFPDNEVREREIKNISKAYTELKKDVLPKLRRSDIILNFVESSKADTTIMRLMKTKPTELSVEEMLYASDSLVKDIPTKEAYLRKVTEQYPNDWRGFNNLGVMCLQQEKLADAKTALEKANELNPKNPKILNNLGVLALANKDYEAAERYFTEAAENGGTSDQITYNLSFLLIRKGDYKGASGKLKTLKIRTFNESLATMLGRSPQDVEDAGVVIGQTSNQKNAYTYYLKAIINARKNATEASILNELREAVKLDASLKDYAKNDLEFKKLFKSDTFKQIVQ